MSLKEVLLVYEQIGLLDVILPFMLVFAIVYGVLAKSKLLGASKNQHLMIAFVLSFFVVAALTLVNIIQTIVQWSALGVIGIVFVLIIGKFLGGMGDTTKKEYPKYIALVIIALVAAYALGFKKWIDLSFIDWVLVPVAIMLAMVFLLIYYVTRTEPKSVKPVAPARQETPPEDEGSGELEEESDETLINSLKRIGGELEKRGLIRR